MLFWDRVAGIYDIFCKLINRKTCAALQREIGSLIRHEDEVLECACGTGLLTGVIADACRSLTATDYAGRMLMRAREKYGQRSNVVFRQGDITRLDFPDQSFDAVVAANVIHLLDDPSAALRELLRVCRSGGRVIIPTYINRKKNGGVSPLIRAIDRAGAAFPRQFTQESYRQFFLREGCADMAFTLLEGLIPCSVAVIRKA